MKSGRTCRPLGDQRRLRRAAGPGDDLFLERVERVAARADNSAKAGCSRSGRSISSAERRLPAVDEPLIQGGRAEMQPQIRPSESGLVGKRHTARRRAPRSKPDAEADRLACRPLAPQRTRGARVRRRSARRRPASRPQGHCRGCLGRQSLPERRTGPSRRGADARDSRPSGTRGPRCPKNSSGQRVTCEIAELASRWTGQAGLTTRWRETTGNQ